MSAMRGLAESFDVVEEEEPAAVPHVFDESEVADASEEAASHGTP